ncbi:hypothetical protein I4U23_011041 [Adineta vaga]|nr:hypothetical protein I4U23_011041 [Adineta vaga]
MFEWSLCGLDQDLCYVKYNERSQSHYPSSYQCYNPTYQACLNNAVCQHSQVCEKQCLQENQLCINNKTICHVSDSYGYYYYLSTLAAIESCNGTCYNTGVHECVNDTIQCPHNNNCSGTCYNSSTHKCFNGTLCSLDVDICHVKYNQLGRSNGLSSYQCYNPTYQVCLNDALCYQSQVCDQQCLRENQLCINNKTICNSRNRQWYYDHGPKLNATESCNGICYDLSVEQCTDSTIQCIDNNNCSGICYDPSTHKCLNGILCSVDEDLCIVQYDSWGRHYDSQSVCYKSQYKACFNNTMCYKSRVCDQRCLRDNQLCINNKTICQLRNGGSYYNHEPRFNTYESCNDTCYDPDVHECIDDIIQCINNSHCSSTCYNSSTHKCLNETLCGLDEDLCSVNYYEWDISYYSKPQCYNPRNQACLNHTVCDRSLVCDQQCQRQGQLCTDNKTICNVPSGVSFYAYQSTSPAIKSCNGMCYTVADKECIDGTIQCINNNNCSGTCYNSSIHKCFNGTLCGVNEDLCIVRYSSWGTQYYTQSLCYNPKDQVCLNNTLCHQSRVCKQHCLLEYQLCANNNTACNGTLLNYTRYGENLIHVCGGICYDPSIQRCIDGNVRTFLPETTTGKFVPSDYHSSWWDIFKVNCYILITIFVIFFIIRQLCGWSSTKTEKSIYLDADRIPLMKNDEI